MSEISDISDRIGQARRRAGIPSAAEAARRLQMEPHAYRHYESGTRTPPTARLPDIARLYKVSLEWLITGKGDQTSAEVTSLWEHMPAANRPAALRMLRSLSDDDEKRA
jgi:transcriptional regulator with XRE-family HTH domain